MRRNVVALASIVALAFSLGPVQAEDSGACAGLPAGGEEATFIEENCEAFNKAHSCAKEPENVDVHLQTINRLFSSAETHRENILRLWDTSYKNSSLAQMFNADSHKSMSSLPPVPLLEWFREGQPDIGEAEAKQRIIDGYVKHAKDFDCAPKIVSRHVFRSFPGNRGFATEQEARDALKDKSKLEEFQRKGQGAEALKQLVQCSSTPGNFGPWQAVAQRFPPCSGNISQQFANNAWAISPADAAAITGEDSELATCIRTRLAAGAKIHHVSVVSSASRLNNTGDAAARFCAKGFKQLSEARAQSAVDTILPRLFSDPTIYAGDKLEVNSNGTNQDGTSGECPYTLVNGREVLKPEFAPGGARRAELDSSRYVRVAVTFNEVWQPTTATGKSYQAHFNCRQISFQCR